MRYYLRCAHVALGYLSGDGHHVELVLLCGGFADSTADVKSRLRSCHGYVRVHWSKHNGASWTI